VTAAATTRREELLEVGLELFSAHAFDELSIDDIARRAGVAKGLLYYYFGSKRGFYVEVVRAAAAELRMRWDADPSAPPAERLLGGLEAYLAYARDHAAGYRALMAGGIGTDPEVRGVLAAERELLIERVVEALALKKPTPALRTALQGFMSFMEGATLEWLDDRTMTVGELRDLMLAALGGALAGAHTVDPSVPASLPWAR
jgi:AcrR family transcriptional regulator